MLGDYKIKRDFTNNFQAKNDTYELALPIYEVDTRRIKVGDGVNQYNDLPYLGYAGSRHMIEYDELFIDKDTSGTGAGNEVFLTSSNILKDDPNVFEAISTSQLKLKQEGIYWLSSRIIMDGNVDAELRLYLNGALLTAQDFVKSTTDLSTRNIRVTFMEKFNKDDVVSVSVVNYDTVKSGNILAGSIGFAMKVV